MTQNTLYYGDNLDVLRRHIADESVDLVYLDPPFNSNANYNQLFAEQDGHRSAAQIKAFEDTWRWDQAAAKAYDEITVLGGRVSDAMQAFHKILGHSDMLAYLAMMAPRLVELHRVLKPTGSLYLHCDPTASHYLKLLLDAVFGPVRFINEITWKRTSSHNDAKRKFGDLGDTILSYAKGENYLFSVQYKPYDDEYVSRFYRHDDGDGRKYTTSDLRSPNPRPNLTYDYKGYKPHPNGWTVSREKMEQLDKEGRLWFPKDPAGRIRVKKYLDEMPGIPIGNIWDDISPIHAHAAERLGYPTQKPSALLERIINASSHPGDVVLDPFCGCGTAVVAAQRLGRQWMGIDITHLAINLIKRRLKDNFGDAVEFQVMGEPVSLPDAEQLAAEDPYQFQWWALSLVDARMHLMDKKKGSDGGVDGKLLFQDDASKKLKQVIFSVKAGKAQVSHLRDLRGVLDRENAAIGVLVCLHPPTSSMKKEAATAGFYRSPGWGSDHPRLQILTIEQLLKGKKVDMPPVSQVNQTFKKAETVEAESKQVGLF